MSKKEIQILLYLVILLMFLTVCIVALKINNVLKCRLCIQFVYSLKKYLLSINYMPGI